MTNVTDEFYNELLEVLERMAASLDNIEMSLDSIDKSGIVISQENEPLYILEGYPKMCKKLKGTSI